MSKMQIEQIGIIQIYPEFFLLNSRMYKSLHIERLFEQAVWRMLLIDSFFFLTKYSRD